MSVPPARPGPLAGITVVEMAGLGPAPLAALILAEMGAQVLRIERLRPSRAFLTLDPAFDTDRHGRTILRVDLKAEAGRDIVRRLVAGADVLIEGFRPGVMERLGLGPETLCADQPRLVYARMTGYGQSGPLAQRAGHDITYLALSGLLSAIGEKGGRPLPPLNLVADFGGGAMVLIAGILAALVERSTSGRGQVVDAAMVEGAAMLAIPYYGYLAAGIWREGRGSNLLDSGAPFYDTYATADGQFMAVACLEPEFFALFAERLPLPDHLRNRQYDQTAWPELRSTIAERMATRSRAEWTALFEGTDACVAPVLSLAEATSHPHNVARGTHVAAGRFVRPAPAPRFSRTPTEASVPYPPTAPSIDELLEARGLPAPMLAALRADGVIGD